jgi:hypothetical protein
LPSPKSPAARAARCRAVGELQQVDDLVPGQRHTGRRVLVEVDDEAACRPPRGLEVVALERDEVVVVERREVGDEQCAVLVTRATQVKRGWLPPRTVPESAG